MSQNQPQLNPEQLEKQKERETRKKALAAEKAAKFAAKKAQQQQNKKQGTSSQPTKPTKKEAKKEAKKEVTIEFTPPPEGEKKDVINGPFPTVYDPSYVESSWYSWWEKQGYFKPRFTEANKDQDPFCMCIPPANVTGFLHLGHTLLNAIEDSIVRWVRMTGRPTLWLPGTDHAGIATQVAVEKKIARETGKMRHDLGREAFVNEVWKWKAEYGDRISRQLRKLGSSLDWDREVFTMDEKRCHSVQEAFIRMHDQGLIYRENRLVNWCCALKTAISEIEVDYIDITDRTLLHIPNHEEKVEFGVLTSFAYPVIGTDKEVIVATTRIETMLGDTAIAVHSKDKRYQHLIGKKVQHPFVERQMQIITDDELVDMEFGTACVKITPSHDPNDYECGKRHSLEFINILNNDGTLNDNCGEFSGLKRFEARVKVLEALKARGLYRGTQTNPMRIGLCSRTKDVIEPLLVPQWYVSCKDLANKSIDLVKSGEIEIIPSSMIEVWYRWLENIRDWCISRQLWWGHRIPAYLVTVAGEPVPDPKNNADWFVCRSSDEAVELAMKKFNLPDKTKIVKVEQDEDVLDTWFSSGLYPFASFGWPDDTEDLRLFYPNTLLETGHDILFFWVARMVMMALSLTGKSPFKKVFLHSMVRDAHGRKMSKSLGNVIDPIDVIQGIDLEGLHKQLFGGNLDPREVEKAKQGQKQDFPNGIARCGADALRFALVVYTNQGRNINLDIQRVVGYRNFCNKIWNATRFALMNFSKEFVPLDRTITPLDLSEGVTPMEKWILSLLANTVITVNNMMQSWDFSAAAQTIYNFFLYDFCDVYLETTKATLSSPVYGPHTKEIVLQTLYQCLDSGLRLFHPFLPFLTEDLWQRIPRRASDLESIMISQFPVSLEFKPLCDPSAEKEFDLIKTVVKALRQVSATYLIPQSKRPNAVLVCKNEGEVSTLKHYQDVVKVLSYSGDVSISLNGDHPIGLAFSLATPSIEVYLDIKDMINVPAEIAKLTKKKSTIERNKANLEKSMAIPSYEEKVPEHMRLKNSEKLKKNSVELEAILKAINNFSLLQS